MNCLLPSFDNFFVLKLSININKVLTALRMNLFENMVGTGENADNQNFVFFMPPP